MQKFFNIISDMLRLFVSQAHASEHVQKSSSIIIQSKSRTHFADMKPERNEGTSNLNDLEVTPIFSAYFYKLYLFYISYKFKRF